MPENNSQSFLLIQDIRDGIILTKNGGMRTVLACSSLNFDLKSEDEQNAIIYQYQGFLNSLDFTIQILIQSRVLNLENYIKNLQELSAVQENPLLQIQTNEYIDFIKSLVEVENIMTKNFYIVVPFDTPVINQKGLMSLLKPQESVNLSNADFNRFQEQLWQRVQHVIIGLSGMDVRAVALGTPELIELFYNFYNPQPGSRKSANLDQWATS